jgi:hypothetical protein
MSTVMVMGVPCPACVDAVNRIRQQCGDHNEKDDGETRQQNIERDLVRRLLTLCAFDHADHAVEKSLPRVGADTDDEPVGKEPRAACDSGTVTARLTHHGSGFARHRAFIHRSDADDDLAVSGENIASFDEIQIIFAE